VAVNYTAMAEDATTVTTELDNLSKKGTKAVAIYRDTDTSNASGATANATTILAASAYYAPANTAFPTTTSRTLCLNKIGTPGKDNRFDREETTPASTTTDFTISPVIVAATPTLYICGEAAVISINAGGVTDPSALGATVARNDITFPVAYTDGWLSFATPSASAPSAGVAGLPILGQAFIRAANGAVNYGFGYAHKTK